MNCNMKPIGYMKSLFHYKNGTPRQSSLCETARGILVIEKSVFTNPEHSLEGLEEYSHAWILFVFHKNNNPHSKAKVKPPRLNGRRVGVFASRSPYRPNNIGLSLVAIDKVEGSSVHVSGIDILDGTPVLDIKPYIPEYDAPQHTKQCENETGSGDSTLSDATATSGELNSFQCAQETAYSVHENSRESAALSGDQSLSSGDDPGGSIICASDSRTIVSETDTKTSVDSQTESVHDLSKGFYSMSEALDKAGQKLMKQGVAAAACSNSDSEVSEEMLGTSILGVGDAMEEGDISDLIGSIISHAAQDLTDSLAASQNVPLEEEDNSLSVSDHHSKKKTSVKGYSSSQVSTSSPNQSADKYLSRDSTKSISKKSRTTQSSVNVNEKKHPVNSKTSEGSNSAKGEASKISTVTAPWLKNPPVSQLFVSFTSEALQQLQQFSPQSPDPNFCLQMIEGPDEARKSILDILQEDPRSVYRRSHCGDSLYFFAVDVLHVTCWFDSDQSAQVVRVQPTALATKLKADIQTK